MKPLLLLLCCPLLCLAQSSPAPAPATIALSLRTVSKALAQCREVYTETSTGTSTPILKLVLSAENYGKDMKVLREAELFTNTLIAHPERTTGKALVAILSTMDDVSVGAGSTRFEVLSSAITNKAGAPKSETLFFMSEAINSCQRALFDAGDDYVTLVLDFVGAEDEAKANEVLSWRAGTRPHLLIWARFEAETR
jgi:hypothetical protein